MEINDFKEGQVFVTKDDIKIKSWIEILETDGFGVVHYTYRLGKGLPQKKSTTPEVMLSCLNTYYVLVKEEKAYRPIERYNRLASIE